MNKMLWKRRGAALALPIIMFSSLCGIGYGSELRLTDDDGNVEVRASVRGLGNKQLMPPVVEFFSFYCPPCFAFSQQYGVDKGIREVLLSGKKMTKYHVDFLGPLGPQLTDAWATAQVMGIEDKVEPLLFEAAQVTRSLTTPESIRAVFEKAGVTGEEYDRMMDSILVKAKAAEMRQLFRDYKVTSTPAVFVNGQHINNSDFRGETPEAYRQEYVAAVEKLLKTGG
ncbi:thioredoxin domain-containing protein [Escherichia coli]|nr:thioredoxin domain-containing protein [Escherichia coli]